MTGSREDTISKYYRFIKNAIHKEVQEELQSFVLGGEGERVQIDESHVFTRKYNVGRVLVTTTFKWVFGIVEDKPNGKLFLQMVRFRDRETLEPLIESMIRKSTIVFSDSWPSYHNLNRLGYKHYQVNHKKHFIEVQDEILTQSQINQNVMNQMVRAEEQSDEAEDTSDQQPENVVNVNTQRIERAWREVKRGLQGQPLSLASKPKRRNVPFQPSPNKHEFR